MLLDVHAVEALRSDARFHVLQVHSPVQLWTEIC